MSARGTILPFTSNLEYLSTFLEFLSALTRRQIIRRNLELKRAGVDANSRGRNSGKSGTRTAASRREEKALADNLKRAERNCVRKEQALSRRTQLTLELGKIELPLEKLAKESGLSEFEKRVIALVLGPGLDNTFRRLTEEIGGGCYIEVRIALDLLCATTEEKIRARKYFIHTGNLLGKGLLNLNYSYAESENGFMDMSLELPRRISSLIMGEHDVDDLLTTFSRVIDPEVDFSQVVLPPEKLKEVMELLSDRADYMAYRKAWGFDRILPYGRGTVLLFAGPSGAGKTMLAHALAKATGHRLLLIDLRAILNHSRNRFEENLQRAFLEARLQHAILFFDEADEMFSDRSCNFLMPTLLREFEKLDGIAILATNRKQILDEALERRILYKLDFEVPAPDLREAIWRKHLPPEAPLAGDVDFKTLADDFEFTGGFIKNAVLVAVHHALRRKGDARKICQSDLREGAQLQRRNRLDSLTDRVIPKAGLSDVVLPPGTRKEVEAIVAAARKRLTVYSSWGFGKRLTGGKALSALFIGESGTGKTMTAEAIAFELGQCLYPVKVPSIVSMWYGETEKNLAAVFRGAKESQAILFFDEADSLFISRADHAESPSASRWVNVLLTELERYDGIVVLATNRAESFDVAFERRLCYRVTFPIPEVDAREAIWRGMIPREAPLCPAVDFAALARDYAFTGGTIKNVVLRAAFAAAMANCSIDEEILRSCARNEKPLRENKRLGFELAARR
jgi:SpoVK/Ycf46/Vps4 family AAA+-type ATPase